MSVSDTDPFDGQWRDIAGVLTTDQPTELVADRRIQRRHARAAEKRADRHDAIQTWKEKRSAARDDRQADRAERRELRAEKRTDRQESAERAKDFTILMAQRLLVTFPILAPMAVAWTGQSQFAIIVLGWAFVASILYAAAYELTTVYWAWLYHQARTDGDSGWEYRLATWVFAAGAAVQQWWHYSNHWHATPRAVTYSVMSAVGVLLWEGRARLIHRRKLRSEGKLPPARPRIGLTRWVRYPVRSWTAWSLITLEGHLTLDAAWTAAEEHLRSRKVDCEDRSVAKRSAREADRSARAARTVDRKSVRLDRVDADRPDRPVKQVDRTAGSGPDRLSLSGPDRTADTDRSDLVDRTVSGPASPDRSDAPSSGPGRARTAGPNLPNPVDRSTTDDSATSTADQGPGPDRTTETDGLARPTVDLILSETEHQAIELLRSTGRSISKRNIADAVRTELGRSIGSDRAAEIARHFRSLRSAA